MALESKETVYFDEEASCARAAVKEVVDMFDGLLEKLPESDRGAVQRSMGLKIEQLKAEIRHVLRVELQVGVYTSIASSD
ncbi:hypothetical protein CK203_081643 [Vitis vinifera]|uniref:Uncharacterized protein n=1 Tax=Vitis vinifera TaxID=29760 RepID=A0A438DPL9_VITVI|nr:hypothetical protein CK203_081643 [Vitis vinifera]